MTSPMEMNEQHSSISVEPGNAPPPLKVEKPSESLKLEHQFLRVPFELYKKMIRANHRTVEKELSTIVSGISNMANADISRGDAIHQLNSFASGLQGLKRKLEEGKMAEQVQSQRCRIRLEHLASAKVDSSSEWDSIRLKRILIDYMLRTSYYNTAEKLSWSSNFQDDLADTDMFHEAKEVIDSLKRKELDPALAWCLDNKHRLKKSKSKFEFLLRLQEFIELVREEKCMQAITFARKYLAPWGALYMKELHHVTATLAFRHKTECPKYKVLFTETQWDNLIHHFKQEFYNLYGMTSEPLLYIYLQAGLSAIKTPYCHANNCTKEDPLSQESFQKLALELPYSKQDNSTLVCQLSRESIDTDNPPLVLPNGYVYGSKALGEMAKKNNGKVTCPRTGLVCNYTDLFRAYVV